MRRSAAARGGRVLESTLSGIPRERPNEKDTASDQLPASRGGKSIRLGRLEQRNWPFETATRANRSSFKLRRRRLC